jgi:hypothetical protein
MEVRHDHKPSRDPGRELILRSGRRKGNSSLFGHQGQAAGRFSHGGSGALAKLTVYTKGQTPQQTRDEILRRLLVPPAPAASAQPAPE